MDPTTFDPQAVMSVLSDPVLLLQTLGIGRGSKLVVALVCLGVLMLARRFTAWIDGWSSQHQLENIMDTKNVALAIDRAGWAIAIAIVLTMAV